MKFEIPLLTGLIFLGSQLLARAQVQGFEAALISSSIDYGLRGWRAVSQHVAVLKRRSAR
jgi:hypothetical protein